MKTPWILVAVIIALGGLYVLFPLVLHTFQRYRHKKVVTCPQTGGLAEVDVNSRRAAFSSAFGRVRLRVKSCTLWPKRKGCAEDCVKE
ncbi:MAG: hypothetical protein ACE5MK_13460 [Acidobacteriota bacterium]